MEIKSITNGYLISETNDEGKIELTAFTYDDFDEDDIKRCVTELLYYIAEKACLMTNDKWQEDNLNITWDKKGSKVE